MPAGNDTEHAASFRMAVESQFGPYQNAEELIRSHQASIDPGLRRAGLSRVDEEATAKLTEDMAATAKKFKDAPAGSELESVAVRGNAIVGVFSTPDGSLVKRVMGANDKFGRELTPADKAARASAQADAQVAQETARLRADVEARVAEARAEAEEQLAAELEKIQEQAQKDVEKAQEAAAKEAEKSAGSGTTKGKETS